MKRIAERIKDKRTEMALGVLVCCAMLGWWGTVYPQFTMVRGTYEIVYEEGTAQEDTGAAEGEPDGADVYRRVMKADRDRIRFRSKLLRNINTLQGQRRRHHESGDQR